MAALLSSYADATSEPDTPEWLLNHGKLPGGKPVADASTREIANAVTKARGTTARKTASPEGVAARRAARRHRRPSASEAQRAPRPKP